MTDASVRIKALLLAAAHRPPGYLEAVMSAGVVDGDFVRIPRERYEELVARFAPSRQGQAQHGPGSELKALLAYFGIHAGPACSCNRMAAQMNSWGPDESLKHIEQIVDVMQSTAAARRLPFLRSAAKTLVRIACAKARRKAGQSGH